MNKEIKLSVNDLKVSFRTDAGKVQAVRNISFDLYKGETLAIVGESGSGKSVTSKAIMGISAVNSIYEGGEILYDGQDLTRIPEEEMHKLRGDKIAMIFQESTLTYLGIVNLDSSTTTSVGTMLANGRQYLSSDPHIILFPALFISLLMISFNLFGNGLRDAFNPALRGSDE